MPHARRLLTLALLALIVGASLTARRSLGIEWSVASLQETVAGLGWKGPLGFLLLVSLRQFLLIPSSLILTTGGLLFGIALGTLLGGAGIVASALICFGAARGLVGDRLRTRLLAQLGHYEEHARRAGPLVIGLSTAHPMGLVTPLHVAAGASSISLLAFLVSVMLAGPVRAAAYSLFGAHILDWREPRFWLISGAVVLVGLLPLLHPSLRSRILPQRARTAGDSPGIEPLPEDGRRPHAAGRPPGNDAPGFDPLA